MTATAMTLWFLPWNVHAAEKSPVYLVLFSLSVAEDGSLKLFEPVKTIDLLSGSNEDDPVELSQAFLEAARKSVEDKRFEPTVKNRRQMRTYTSMIYVPADTDAQDQGISYQLLDGAMGDTSEFLLMAKPAAVSTFGHNLGDSALFIGYYAVSSLPRSEAAQREAIIDAEIKRCIANVGKVKEVKRDKSLSTDTQTIVDFSCKSFQNSKLVIRSRYICNDRQMLTLSAVTSENMSERQKQEFDKLFDNFKFRE
ncbi:MAG: hypothetical protein AAF571_00315 [Verrucomicrobiota bacterium]